MVKHAPGINRETCPHIDRNDQGCGHRFSLGRIEQAFSVCFGAFHGCPMYHRLNRDDALAAARVQALSGRAEGSLTTVTANGHAIALRPTGS